MGDRLFNAYYKECNMQGTWIIFRQAFVVQSAQNVMEITPAVVGVSKRSLSANPGDLTCLVTTWRVR